MDTTRYAHPRDDKTEAWGGSVSGLKGGHILR